MWQFLRIRNGDVLIILTVLLLLTQQLIDRYLITRGERREEENDYSRIAGLRYFMILKFAIVAHDRIDRSARRGAIKRIVTQILNDDRVYTIKSKTGSVD